MMMNRAGSWRHRATGAAAAAAEADEKRGQEDFGSAGSIAGCVGDSSVGMSEIMDGVHSRAGSSLDGGSPSKQEEEQHIPPSSTPGTRKDISYFDEDDSVLLWSDDPEKEYFAYMLSQEQEHRALQGKSAEDSLLGDSTIEEIEMHHREWKQNGGENSAEYAIEDIEQTPSGFDVDDDDDHSPPFPILSAAYNSNITTNSNANHTAPASASFFGGFSLATTEKSPTIQHEQQHQQQQQQPATPIQEPLQANGSKSFPGVIYVTDAPPTPATISSRLSQEDNSKATTAAGRGNCFYIIIFLLGGVALAGAAVAVYLSLANDDDSSNNTSSSAFENSNGPLTTQTPDQEDDFLVPMPSTAPTLYPSALLQKKTLAPTFGVGDDGGGDNGTARPTKNPTVVSTTAAPTTATPNKNPTKEPTQPVATQRPTQGSSVPDGTTDGTVRCGCKDCAAQLWRLSDGVPCGDRIDFLIVQRGLPEENACRQVAGVEFPTECSGTLCNPDECLRAPNGAYVSTPSGTADPGPTATSSPVTTLPAATAMPVSSSMTMRPTTRRPSPRPTPMPSLAPMPTTRQPTTPMPTSLRPATRQPTTPMPSLRPTPRQPTARPTPKPTSLELIERGNDGSPGNAFPLGRCEGDCDSDDECGEGLVCFRRNPGDGVPGCLEGSQETSRTDFCVPEGFTLHPTFQPTIEPTFEPTQIPVRVDTTPPTTSSLPDNVVPLPDDDNGGGDDGDDGDGGDDDNVVPVPDDDNDGGDDGDDGFTGVVCGLIGVFC